MIHNFKSYTPFIVIKYCYIPFIVQYILVVYFIPNSLYLLLPYPYIAPPPFPLPLGNHSFVFYICEYASFLSFLIKNLSTKNYMYVQIGKL